MHELKDAAKPESEEECARNSEKHRTKLVLPVRAEHAVQEGGSLGVEVEVMHKLPGQRIRMGVEIRLKNQQSRQNSDKHIQREKGRLQRAFHLPVTTPRPNRHPAPRPRTLSVDPRLAPLRDRVDAGPNPGEHPDAFSARSTTPSS